jgi:hypothetical protein
MEATMMNKYSILPDGRLAITASESSSKRDFDFLVGGWKVRSRKLKEPLSGRAEWDEFDATQNLRQILHGLGNFDIFSTEVDGKPLEVFTLRLFDPKTRLWTIYWADSHAGKLDGGKVGSFSGDIGEFFAREVFAGKSVIVRFLWDKRNPEAPVWSAAYSSDEGQTWEWNWHAHFVRPSLYSTRSSPSRGRKPEKWMGGASHAK